MSHMRRHIPAAIAAGAAAAALLGACSSPAASPAAAAPASSTQAGPQGAAITARLTEFHIALSRSTLTAGTYTFRVRNAGTITHGLTIDGKGVRDKTTGDLNPGQTATLTVTLAAGTYQVFCPVSDHRAEGMDTTVRVSGK